MGDDRVKDEAMEIIAQFQVLPRLVVFDLDYTLWPFYCECLSKRNMPSLYPHAKGILKAFRDKGVDIAIASRSPTPDIASTFLEKLGIKSMFVAQEIFSSWTHKTDHFQKIKRRTGVPYSEMLFFDDEDRNIETVSKMGVTSILVDDGVDLGALRRGLSNFSRNHSSLEKNKQRWGFSGFAVILDSHKHRIVRDAEDEHNSFCMTVRFSDLLLPLQIHIPFQMLNKLVYVVVLTLIILEDTSHLCSFQPQLLTFLCYHHASNRFSHRVPTE